MWLTLVVLGILGTFGPAPGSLEGMFFTIFPLWVHLRGLPKGCCSPCSSRCCSSTG